MNDFDVTPFASLDPEIKELIKKSTTARENAHSPYSNFKVGAALLCSDGTIFTGCNVENNSFSAGICAERTAIVKAISEGRKEFKVIAVVADMKDNFVAPCGVCRQMLSEFGNVVIYLSQPEMKTALRTSLKDLLPLQFSLRPAL